MPTIDQNKALLIVSDNISRPVESYHRDYGRVTELAELYTKLITGENIDSLLIRYNPRETPDQFDQRKRITQLVTPAVTEKIKSPFNKVARIDNVKRSIVFDDAEADDNNEKVKKIEKAMTEFYGDNTLDEFMEDDYIEQSFLDPNSFIVVEVEKFDKAETMAKPFPVIFNSKEAVNFKYEQNQLLYLVVKTDITIHTQSGPEPGEELRIYTQGFIIKIRQVEDKRFRKEGDDFKVIRLVGEDLKVGEIHKMTIGEKLYEVEIFIPDTDNNIQACRIGYKKDASTRNRTFINPFHKALARLMKSVKSTSELDLTIALQTFPRTAQYVPKCNGKKNDTCDKGEARNGKCTICNGTGWDITKSSQEMLTMPLPRDKDDMIDLDKLIHTDNIDVNLPKFMNEYLIQLENQAMTDVFVSESLTRITTTKTATEKEIDMESIYDVLLPFANHYSAVWRKLVKLSALFIDQGTGVTITHSFPKDFKLKTVNALIDDRQKAMTAQAPSYLLQEIDNDLAVKLHADNSQDLRQYQIRQEHIPFKGKTDAQIQIAINMNLTTMFDKVLWSNFDAIFGELEAEAMAKKEDFYDLTYDQRVALISAKVLEYITKIEAQRSSSSLFPTTPEAEANDDLEMLTRDELLAFINDNNLEIEVADEQDEDAIIAAIRSAQETPAE